MFSISSLEISSHQLHQDIQDQRSGAVVIFEGIVRNHNQGLDVKSLEYQVYHELAQKEGDKILQEAKLKFNIHQARAVHREGHLRLGEIAVWVGTTASHRDDAFKATRYIIDEIKHRLPVWKKEHYLTADAKWVFCRDHHHHVHFEEKDFYQKQKNILDQNRLKKTHVLMVGLGGLGCPASVNLALAGVGKLTLVDYDKVSYDNLHRQFLFRPQHVGESKVKIAASLLKEMNPFIEIDYHDSFFRPDHLEGIDFVIDGSDNMKTKYQIHDACLKYRLPLLSAGLFRDDIQIRTMIPGDGCWRCLQDLVPDDALFGNCNDFGTTGAWANTAGSILASEALELISSGKNSTTEMVHHLNLRTLTSFKVKKARKEDCQYCAGNFELLDTVMEVDEALSGDILDIRHLSDDEVLKSIQSREKVILCCHRGHRSLKVTQWLREQGHDHVYSLRGGAPR